MTKLTSKKREVFFAALAEYGNVSRAAEAIEVSRQGLYKERKLDTEFATAWDEALEVGTHALADEARRRAFEGVTTETPIYHKGVLVDKVIETKYSDTLLIFLLKSHMPEVYRDRSSIDITMKPVEEMTDDELLQVRDGK